MAQRRRQHPFAASRRPIALTALLAFSLFTLAGFAVQHVGHDGAMGGCPASMVRQTACAKQDDQTGMLNLHLGALRAVTQSLPTAADVLLVVLAVLAFAGFAAMATRDAADFTLWSRALPQAASPPLRLDHKTLRWLSLLEKRDPAGRE